MYKSFCANRWYYVHSRNVHRDANSPYSNKNKLLAGEISTSSEEELDLEKPLSTVKSHNKRHKQLSTAIINKSQTSTKKIPEKKK